MRVLVVGGPRKAQEIALALAGPEREQQRQMQMRRGRSEKRSLSLRDVVAARPCEVKLWLPTLLLDATLPDQSILQVYHPQVEVVGRSLGGDAAERARQAAASTAPTSANKLGNEKQLHALAPR